MQELIKKTTALVLLLSFMVIGGIATSVSVSADDGEEISTEDSAPATTTIEESSEDSEDTSLSDE